MALREILDALGLTSFARTTGGKGLHVVLPIERRTDWAVVKAFAHEVVATLARTAPDRYVLTASKAQRKGRIFLDYLRNDRGATAVASWSSRARPAAPVAMPLRWDEVSAELEPQAFTVQWARRLRRMASRRSGVDPPASDSPSTAASGAATTSAPRRRLRSSKDRSAAARRSRNTSTNDPSPTGFDR